MDEGSRQPIPPMAWVLSGATAVAVVVLAAGQLRSRGVHQFFDSGDPRLFLLTTRDLFGVGRGFAAVGRATEIPYRYGRGGLPFVGWLLALGRPALVGWTLIGVNLAALIAIPGLSALLLIEYGAPPAFAAVILLLPDFLLLYGSVVAEPLLIALLVLAYLLVAREHRGSALVVLAGAILVKEIALVALIPLMWRAFRFRDWRGLVLTAGAAIPYLAWCVWLRFRVEQFPFLTHTRAREGALGLPFAGLRHTITHFPIAGGAILATTALTIILCFWGAWVARGTLIAGLAGLLGLVTVCLGPEALRYVGETMRVLLVPQVFGLLALVIGLRGRPAGRIDRQKSFHRLEETRA